MPTYTLTDAKCRTAKPAEKDYKMFDGGGLFLWVSPKGAKVWRCAYRLDGKQQTASLGKYPTLSLAEARNKHAEMLAKLANGISPKDERRPRNTDRTLEQANEEYWATRKDLSPGYVSNGKRAIELHIYPRFRNTKLRDITRADLLDALMAVDAAGKHVYVRRTRMWLCQLFDWAMEFEYCDSNPAKLINSRKAFTRTRVRHMPALDPRDMPDFFMRLNLEDELQSVLACRLMALTWMRTTELRTLKWGDIQGDLIVLGSDVMKNGKDHLVPLSSQAQEIIKKLRARRNGSDFVFPCDRRTDRAMSENAVLYLLHRMGYKGRMSGHGWRSVGSTWANEAGIYAPDVIERQLAHSPENKVRSAYNRAEYLPQRRALLQDWANWLDSCQVDTGRPQG